MKRKQKKGIKKHKKCLGVVELQKTRDKKKNSWQPLSDRKIFLLCKGVKEKERQTER